MCNEKFWEPEFLKKKECNIISAPKENKSETSQHNYRTSLIISDFLGNISATDYYENAIIRARFFYNKTRGTVRKLTIDTPHR